MFIIIVFKLGSDKLFSCLFADCSLSSDQSRDVTSRLAVSDILQCTSFHFHASLLQLCNNKFAEALVVYRNSLLNRLTAD